MADLVFFQIDLGLDKVSKSFKISKIRHDFKINILKELSQKDIRHSYEKFKLHFFSKLKVCQHLVNINFVD